MYKSDSLCLNLKRGGEGGNGHANKGKKHSEEQIEAWKAFMKEYYKDHRWPGTGKGTIVECYDDDGELVGRFCTQALAGRVFNKTPIGWALKGENRKEAGFRWRVVDSMFAPISNIGPYVKPKKKMPKEAVEKISAKKRGKEMPWEWVAVIGTNKDTGVEKQWPSIRKAAAELHPENTKAAEKNIQCACKGRRKSSYGYTNWRYV